jgi:hypothetical protein
MAMNSAAVVRPNVIRCTASQPGGREYRSHVTNV